MLNPELYGALQKAFGAVQIHNEDDPLTLSKVPIADVLQGTDGLRVTSDMIDEGGEYYAVNCPFCEDRRQRLWVCYAWGSKVELGTKTYSISKGVAYCYNELCLKVHDNWVKFCQAVQGNWSPKLVQIGDEHDRLANDKDDIKVDMPPDNYYVDEPAGDKKVQQYLIERGYSLHDLRHNWDFRIGRIHFYDVPCVIMPVVCQGKYRFWQARYPNTGQIPELFRDGRRKPKYYIPAGAKKSRVLYNFDKAVMTDTIVLVEGIFDAVRVGPSGVAMFGKKPSTRQQMMLLQASSKRLVWIPDMDDPEALDYARSYTEQWKNLNMFAKGAHVLQLKEGDPADYTREELWKLLEQSLATA